MTKLLLIASVFLTSNLALAQSFKVVKIQGKKAIVEVSDPSMISVNQSYNVGDSSMPVSSAKGGKRDHGIAFDLNITNQMTSPSVTQITANGTYLWNFKTYEIGPTLGLQSASGGGASTSSTVIGGLGHYNFNDNKPGVESIWSAVGKLAIGSSSGGGASSSATIFGAGINYRNFLLSPDYCLTFSGIYQMQQVSGSSTSALVITGGIAAYF